MPRVIVPKAFRRRVGASAAAVDMSVHVGAVALPNPVMPASGTYGNCTEFTGYGAYDALGAVVIKSLSENPWAGNKGPNMAPLSSGLMLNAVGLKNPGASAWVRDQFPPLRATGARIVVSIWGFSQDDYAAVANIVANAVDQSVVAIEVNLSCPNLHDPRHIIALDEKLTETVVRRVVAEAGPRPVWAKLSPNAPDIPAIASAAQRGGASAVTLVNTLSGFDIDIESGRPAVGNVYGGVSGPLLLPVALRAVHQVYRECPGLPIVGVGGISCGEDAAKMLMAGASALQVGTANFADPHATHRVLDELRSWCATHGTTPAQLTGRSHA